MQPPPQGEDRSGGMFVKVMTDEQMEVLRKQIAVYATICEQLVELHKSLTSHNDLLGMGNMYGDTLIASGTHKITGRQRWTPTAVQLQILERMFDQGIGTPNKQKIKEITGELSQHGQISETNVYNWFQNRRARSKRKQQSTPANKEESDVDTEVESLSEKKTKPQELQPHHTLAEDEDLCFQNPTLHSVDTFNGKTESILSPEESSKFGDIFGQMPFYDAGIDQIMGKMEEVHGNYSYLQHRGYTMD